VGQFSHWPHSGGGCRREERPPRPHGRPWWGQDPATSTSHHHRHSLLRPRGHSRATRLFARRNRARCRPWRPRRSPPRRHGCLQPEHLGGCKGGDGRCYPANEKHKSEHRPLEIKDYGGNAAHLRLEKPRILFLEGSGAPLSRLPAPPWRSLVPPRRSRALPLKTLQREPPRPPRALPPWPPPRLVVTGVGDSTSRGGIPPSLSSSSSHSDDDFASVIGGEGESLLLAQPILLVLLLPVPAPPDSLLLHARRPLLLPPLCPAARASADPIARRPLSPFAKWHH
jgi:hypothetical protein